jgi:nickel/cobalt exporter
VRTRVVLLLVATTIAVLAGAGPAFAHPLGNFSVNRHNGLVVSPTALRVDHVNDLAEVPTAQAVSRVDMDGDARFGSSELASWAAQRCRDASRDIAVRVGGRMKTLAVLRSSASSTPGQAGLPTLRLECTLEARFDRLTAPTPVEFRDHAAGDQIGWREVTARGDRATLIESGVPEQSRSARLTAYPQDLLDSPPDVGAARLLVRPGGPALAVEAPSPVGKSPAVLDHLTARVGELVDGDLALVTLVAAVLLAMVVGAAHAMAPGHGKTMVAFYLTSQDTARLRSAAVVAVTVTATHTASVLLLGLLVTAGTAFAPERAYPLLTLVSGALVVGVGVTLVRQAADRKAAAHRHIPALAHSHASGPGPDGHPHGHAHAHPHPVFTAPRRGGLVAMGLAGGLLPSPSALVVLLATVAVGKPWLGVLLVLAFGTGMAATLTAAAMFAVKLRDGLSRTEAVLHGRLVSLATNLPLAFAAMVVVLGVLLVERGVIAMA